MWQLCTYPLGPEQVLESYRWWVCNCYIKSCPTAIHTSLMMPSDIDGIKSGWLKLVLMRGKVVQSMQ